MQKINISVGVSDFEKIRKAGIRDLEQAAEHIAANALYQIEVDHKQSVTFDGPMVRKLLD